MDSMYSSISSAGMSSSPGPSASAAFFAAASSASRLLLGNLLLHRLLHGIDASLIDTGQLHDKAFGNIASDEELDHVRFGLAFGALDQLDNASPFGSFRLYRSHHAVIIRSSDLHPLHDHARLDLFLNQEPDADVAPTSFALAMSRSSLIFSTIESTWDLRSESFKTGQSLDKPEMRVDAAT